MCVCCCAETSSSCDISYTEYLFGRKRIRTWNVPCCTECLAHRGKAKWAVVIALFVPPTIFLLVEKLSQDSTFAFDIRRVFALVTCLSIPVLLLVLLARAKRHLTSDCAKLGSPVSFVRSTFFFANSEYATAFVKQNSKIGARSN
jgi:hypothetical protein